MIEGLVTLGYLHPGHLAACFTESLIELMFYDGSGPRRLFHPYGKLAKQCGAAGIVDGRNKLAAAMLDESDAEWLLMVDSDMGFAPDTLERLVEAADPVERPIVGALCFACKLDGKASFFGIRYRATPTLYQWVEPGAVEEGSAPGFLPMFNYERDALVPVAATGGACVLIHRSALEGIRAKYGDAWFDQVTHPVGPTKFSEDLSFCIRAASCDFPTFVHTGIKTTHDKGSVFLDEEYYDVQQALRACRT